jgi:hypothetical protein
LLTRTCFRNYHKILKWYNSNVGKKFFNWKSQRELLTNKTIGPLNIFTL